MNRERKRVAALYRVREGMRCLGIDSYVVNILRFAIVPGFVTCDCERRGRRVHIAQELVKR